MNIKPTQLINNNVLLRLHQTNDKIKFKDGGERWIDTFFNEMQHTNIVADVIAVPEKAYSRDHQNKIIREIPIEIIPGDTVYCFYLAIAQALKMKRQKRLVYNPEGRVIMDNGEIYVLINYDDNIFMAIRNGSPIMVNDYILIEPTYKELDNIQKKAEASGIAVPESMIEQHKKVSQYGIVRYVGRNLSHEWNPNMFSDEDLKPGVEVFITKHADIPLEYSLHQTFEPGKTLFRVRRNNILAILYSLNKQTYENN